jgi:hypothetical protein
MIFGGIAIINVGWILPFLPAAPSDKISGQYSPTGLYMGFHRPDTHDLYAIKVRHLPARHQVLICTTIAHTALSLCQDKQLQQFRDWVRLVERTVLNGIPTDLDQKKAITKTIRQTAEISEAQHAFMVRQPGRYENLEETVMQANDAAGWTLYACRDYLKGKKANRLDMPIHEVAWALRHMPTKIHDDTWKANVIHETFVKATNRPEHGSWRPSQKVEQLGRTLLERYLGGDLDALGLLRDLLEEDGAPNLGRQIDLSDWQVFEYLIN